MSFWDDVITVYIWFAGLLGVQLWPETDPKNFLSKLYSIYSRLVVSVAIALLYITCCLLYFMPESRESVTKKELNLTYFLYLAYGCFALSLVGLIYVWFAAKKMDLAEVIEFTKKERKYRKELDQLAVRGFVHYFVQYLVLAVLFVLIVFLFELCIPEELGYVHSAIYFSLAVCVYYIHTACILGFSYLIDALAICLEPRASNVAELSSEFIERYERIRAFSASINRLLSPVLAINCFINILGVAGMMAFPYPGFYVLGGVFFPLTYVNFPACLKCLDSMTKINQKRFEILNEINNALNQVNKQPLKLMKRTLDFNWWIIDVMLTDDDFYNVGCCVPVDEGTFLLVFQTLYDMYMSMFNYKFTASSKGLHVDWESFNRIEGVDIPWLTNATTKL